MTSNLKNVPPNWQKVRFDEIAEIVTDRIEKPIESGLSDYIGLEHLDTDCIRIKRFGSTEDVDATKFLCKKGDIIFGKRRAYLRKLAVSDRDAVVSAHSMVLRPTGEKIYPDFLPCFMQSSIFWKTAHSISEGSMSPTIKWKTLATQEFWLPSIKEQKRISELLWSIEDNIQKTEKLIETTETFKQGLLNELLTKGIGHTRFKDTELGRIPEEWEVVKLRDICEAFSGGTPSRSYNHYYGNEIPWVKSGEISQRYIYNTEEKITKEGLKNSSAKLVPKNTVLVAMYGATAGKVGVLKIEAATNQAVLAILPKNKSFDYRFMYYYLASKTESLINSTQGSGQPNLSKKIILDLKICLPKIEEQNNICSKISKIDIQLTNIKNRTQIIIKIKKKLINDLISGNLKA